MLKVNGKHQSLNMKKKTVIQKLSKFSGWSFKLKFPFSNLVEVGIFTFDKSIKKVPIKEYKTIQTGAILKNIFMRTVFQPLPSTIVYKIWILTYKLTKQTIKLHLFSKFYNIVSSRLRPDKSVM